MASPVKTVNRKPKIPNPLSRCPWPSDDPLMIGQIQVTAVPGGDLAAAATRIEAGRDEILNLANASSHSLPSRERASDG